jgi:hypothetical protein
VSEEGVSHHTKITPHGFPLYVSKFNQQYLAAEFFPTGRYALYNLSGQFTKGISPDYYSNSELSEMSKQRYWQSNLTAFEDGVFSVSRFNSTVEYINPDGDGWVSHVPKRDIPKPTLKESNDRANFVIDDQTRYFALDATSYQDALFVLFSGKLAKSKDSNYGNRIFRLDRDGRIVAVYQTETPLFKIEALNRHQLAAIAVFDKPRVLLLDL